MKYDVKAFRNKTGAFKQIPPDAIANWVENNFKYKTRKGGSEYTICSPFDDDTGYNFNINPERGHCHDWRGDEWAGPANPETGKRNCSFIKFVRRYLNCSYREAVEAILVAPDAAAEYLKPGVREAPEEAKKIVSVTLPDGVELLGPATGKGPDILKKWLMSRGYTVEDITKHEIYYLGMNVYWPYYEFDTLVYWQSRSRLNKAFNFPAIEQYDRDGNMIGVTDCSKSDFFYGFDDVEMASYVIIVEAIFGQHTLGKQTLASGGASLNDKQIAKLRILGPRRGIILSPDNDKAGIESIISNTQLLRSLDVPLFYSLPPRMEYVKNGKTAYTTDWNDLFEYCHMSKQEIRTIHDKGIKRLTPSELMRLRTHSLHK